jgi:hypothetical protein
MCELTRRRKVWNTLFVELRRGGVANVASFEVLGQTPAADETQIAKDVNRTEVARDLTDSQRRAYFSTLQRVLRAYSNLCPTVGYIQGMNVIVSALLYSVCDDYDHIASYGEFAFKLLVALLEDLRISDFYKCDMKRMINFFGRVEDRVQAEFPEVYTRMVSTEVG